jgi:hypothetical protein
MDGVSYQIEGTGHKTLHILDLSINHVLLIVNQSWQTSYRKNPTSKHIQQGFQNKENETIGGRQDVFCKLLQM